MLNSHKCHNAKGRKIAFHCDFNDLSFCLSVCLNIIDDTTHQQVSMFIINFALMTIYIMFKASCFLYFCSDSDSEKEMRLREAAVSVSDILGPLAQTFTETTDRKSIANIQSVKEDTVTKKTKKKKKRKTSTEGSEEKHIHVSEKQSNGDATGAQTTVVENLTKKKRRKRKEKRAKKPMMNE